jgi:LysM repeat protein
MNRSTIILISILVVLGVIVFFLIPGEKEQETSYKPAEIHFSIDSASTVKIEIQRPGKSVTIENIGGKWTITSPVRYNADPSVVNQLLSGCVRFKIGSLISSNPEKQYLFQVDSSGTKVTLTDRSGKSSGIILGKMGPSFSDIYFRLPGSNEVYLGQGIDSWLVSKDIKDWRDKTIISQPSETIRDLTYQVGSKQYTFHRDSTGWKSDSKSFDPNAMNTTLSALSNLRADDFIDTALKTPTQPITIQIHGNESSTIQLSPSRPDSSKYFVQTPNSQTLFVISKWTALQLLKPVEQHAPAITRPSITSTQTPAVSPSITPGAKKVAVKNPPAQIKPIVPQSAKTNPPPGPITKKESPSLKRSPVSEPKKTVPSPPVATTTKETSNPAPATQSAHPKVKSTSSQGTDEDEGDLSVYTVMKGETMTSVAKKFNVTVEQILKWNLLKSISVKPGQELYIYQRKK